MLLNGKFVFQAGPLDQGFWPDGIYTAPTDEALRFDIEDTKQLGFNMVRKHVKVEPARWYYWCDKLGLLVWQDMPSGGGGKGGKAERRRSNRPSLRQQFETELKRHDRAASESPVHHHVGGLQRRLGPIRHPATDGLGQGTGPVPPGQQRQRLDRSQSRAKSATFTAIPDQPAPNPETSARRRARRVRRPGPGHAQPHLGGERLGLPWHDQ